MTQPNFLDLVRKVLACFVADPGRINICAANEDKAVLLLEQAFTQSGGMAGVLEMGQRHYIVTLPLNAHKVSCMIYDAKGRLLIHDEQEPMPYEVAHPIDPKPSESEMWRKLSRADESPEIRAQREYLMNAKPRPEQFQREPAPAVTFTEGQLAVILHWVNSYEYCIDAQVREETARKQLAEVAEKLAGVEGEVGK